MIGRARMVLATLLIAGLACGSSAAPFYSRIGGRLPPVTGPTLGGGSLSASAYRGRIVVLNFWNQDCPPCRREMSLLQQEASSLAPEGVSVIGVLYVGQSWPDDPAAALAFASRTGVSYPIVTDVGSSWAGATGIQGIPTTVIADRSGRLRFRVLGALKPGELARLVDMIRTGN